MVFFWLKYVEKVDKAKPLKVIIMVNNVLHDWLMQSFAYFVERLQWDLVGVANLMEVRFLQTDEMNWLEKNLVSVFQHDHQYHIHTRLYFSFFLTFIIFIFIILIWNRLYNI